MLAMRVTKIGNTMPGEQDLNPHFLGASAVTIILARLPDAITPSTPIYQTPWRRSVQTTTLAWFPGRYKHVFVY